MIHERFMEHAYYEPYDVHAMIRHEQEVLTMGQRHEYVYIEQLKSKLDALRNTGRVPDIKTQRDMAAKVGMQPTKFSEDINYFSEPPCEGRLPQKAIDIICSAYGIDLGDLKMPLPEFKRVLARQQSPWDWLVEQAQPADDALELLPEHPNATSLGVNKRWKDNDSDAQYKVGKEFFLRLKVQPLVRVLLLLSDGNRIVVLTDVKGQASMSASEGGWLILPGQYYRDGFDFNTTGDHQFLALTSTRDWDEQCQRGLLSQDPTEQRIALNRIVASVETAEKQDLHLMMRKKVYVY